jgi:hypothetical protein
MFIPDPTFFHPGSWIRIKEFKYFNPRKWFLSSRKYDPGCSSRIRILTFYLSQIPDPGVKKAPDPGSGSATVVAHPECLSRILICIHPGSLPDPGSNKSTKRGGGKFFFPSIFRSHRYHKILDNFVFEQVKKIFLAKTLKIIVLFTQKFVIKISKIWV